MVELKDYDIRYTVEKDASYLQTWLTHPDILKWTPVALENEIAMFLRCWMVFCRYRCSLTAVVGEEPCGIGTLFLMPYRKVAHHCQFKLLVAPQWQGKGIGASLLKNLKHLAQSQFHLEILHAEVFEGSPLLPFLKQAGFIPFLRQEGYLKRKEGGYAARILLEHFLDCL